MTDSKSKRAADTDGAWRSRPEDPDTQRRKRSRRLLRNDMLPENAALAIQADPRDDSETEAALKRALKSRDREEPA
jgi:hypothetical protein